MEDSVKKKKVVYINDFRTGKTKVVQQSTNYLARSLNIWEKKHKDTNGANPSQTIRRSSDPLICNFSRQELSVSSGNTHVAYQDSKDVCLSSQDGNKYKSDVEEKELEEQTISSNNENKEDFINCPDCQHDSEYKIEETTKEQELETHHDKSDFNDSGYFMVKNKVDNKGLDTDVSDITMSENDEMHDFSEEVTANDKSVEEGIIQSSDNTVDSVIQDNSDGNSSSDNTVNSFDRNKNESKVDEQKTEINENEEKVFLTKATINSLSVDTFHSNTETDDFLKTSEDCSDVTHVNKTERRHIVKLTNNQIETNDENNENLTMKQSGYIYSTNDNKEGLSKVFPTQIDTDPEVLPTVIPTQIDTDQEIHQRSLVSSQIDMDENISYLSVARNNVDSEGALYYYVDNSCGIDADVKINPHNEISSVISTVEQNSHTTVSPHTATYNCENHVASINVDTERDSSPEMHFHDDGTQSTEEGGEIKNDHSSKEVSTQTDFVFSNFQKMYSILCEKCGHTTDMNEILLYLMDYPLSLGNDRFCTDLEERVVVDEQNNETVNEFMVPTYDQYQYQVESSETETISQWSGITTYGSFSHPDYSIHCNWTGFKEPFHNSQYSTNSTSISKNLPKGRKFQEPEIQNESIHQYHNRPYQEDTAQMGNTIQRNEYHSQFPSHPENWNLTNEYQDHMVDKNLEHAVQDFNLTYESFPPDGNVNYSSNQRGEVHPGGGVTMGESVASLVTRGEGESSNDLNFNHGQQNKVLPPRSSHQKEENNAPSDTVVKGTFSTSNTYYNPIYIQNHTNSKEGSDGKLSTRKTTRSKGFYSYRGDMMDKLSDFAEENYLEVQNVSADGNCMFSAVVDQLWINGNFQFTPDSLRKDAINFLQKHPTHRDGTHLESFLATETWENYLKRMSRDGEWGDHMVLQGVSEVTRFKIIVINADIVKTELSPWHAESETCYDDTALLGHMGEYHYVSLRPMNWIDTWGIKAKIKLLNEIHTGGEFLTVGRNNQLAKENHTGNGSVSGEHILPGDQKLLNENEGTMIKPNTEYEEIPESSEEDTSSPQMIRTDLLEHQTSKESPEFENALTNNENEHIETGKTRENISDRTDDEESTANTKGINLSKFFFENSDLIEKNTHSKTNIRMLGSEGDLLALTTDRKHIDPVSSVSMCHLSFCVSLLLEPSDIYQHSMCSYTIQKSAREQHVDIVVYGKVREGLALSVSYWHQCTVLRPHILCYRSNVADIAYDIESAKSPHSLVVNMDSCKPGVLRLQIVNQKYFEKCKMSELDEKVFLEELPIKFSVNSQEHCIRLQPKYEPAFECPKWPRQLTSEWHTRERPSGFPDSNIIEELSRCPCFLRKNLHHNSQYDQTEWQFVFPDVEIQLLTEKLNPCMLYVLRLFKLLVDFHSTPSPRPLRTNHIKTVMLFACEKLPLSVWSDNIGGALLYLISTLMQSLHKKFLSHYIMISVNLLDAYSDSGINSLIRCIENIRLFPLMAINVFAEHNDLLNKWVIQPIANDMHRFREDKEYLTSIEQTFSPTLLELSKRLVMNGSKNFTKGYEMVKRAFTITKELENGRQVDASQTFEKFVEPFVYSVDDPIVRYFFTHFVDLSLKTDILSKMCETDDVRKIGDIVEKEEKGDYNYFPVPGGNKLDDVEYLESFCQYLMSVEKHDSAAHFLRCAIALGKEGIRSEIIDIGEGFDEEIKTQIGNKNSKTEHNYSRILYTLYNHLIDCYNHMNQTMLFQEFIHDYEELVETFNTPHYYYSHLSKIWHKLGNEEKATYFEAKHKEFNQSKQSSRV